MVNATDIVGDLLIGNKAYSSNGSELREKLASEGQVPHVAVVGCADSRVPVETLFGKGVGDVFVIRNAGNWVSSDEALGSLEYAVAYLGVTVVLVLGHSKCGAVGAAVSGVKNGSMGTASALARHVTAIEGAVEELVKCHEDIDGDVLPKAVECNVRHNVEALLTTPSTVKEFVDTGKVAVIGAVYDITTGLVDVLE